MSQNRLLIVGFLVVHFLFLASGKELLHNHEHDGKIHEDCPVLLIDQILTSGITSHFEIPAGQSFEFFIPVATASFFPKPEASNINSRAPPTV